VAGVPRVTLTGRLTRGDDQPATGYVSVRLLEQLQDPDGDTIVTTQPTRLKLTDGAFSVPVPVTTDPDSPVWVVLDTLPDRTAPEQYVFSVDGTQDPVDLADVQSAPVVTDRDGHAVAIPYSLLGAPGGVAVLDAEGKVPAAMLPPGQGGAVTELDDLTDVADTGVGSAGTVLRKGVDGIWRPSAADAGGMRGDAVWFRPAGPEPVDGHQPNDVWVNTAADFAVYQVEES
jgi:hypothetical protein